MVLKRLPRIFAGLVGLVMVLDLALFGWGAAGIAVVSRPKVAVGVSQWGALAREVAGPQVRVTTLLSDPNADPHQHEATVADAAAVSGASIVVVNGAGYDTWLSQLQRTGAPQARVVNVASIMGVASGSNPHLFYSPRAALRFVTTLDHVIARRLGAQEIATGEARLVSRLEALQRSVTAISSSCHGVEVAATEDVATYLLGDAGLRIVTPETLRLAVGNGVDPTIGDLATALSQVRAHPAFLVDNVQTATPLTAEMVAAARASHVPVIKVTETMGGTDYVSWIGRVVLQMQRALRAQGCWR